MLGLFERQTRDDPRFGLLVYRPAGLLAYRPAGWIGKLSTPLFPGVDVAISIRAQDESEFAVFRRHLEQVIAHCESIRSEIASEALETCQFYQAEERREAYTGYDRLPDLSNIKAYENITSQDHIWPLIKPQEWIFELGSLGASLGSKGEYKSRVVIDFGWPNDQNDHYLVAYLADTELCHLEVDG